MRQRDYWFVIDCTKRTRSAIFKTKFKITAGIVSWVLNFPNQRQWMYRLVMGKPYFDYFQPMTW